MDTELSEGVGHHRKDIGSQYRDDEGKEIMQTECPYPNGCPRLVYLRTRVDELEAKLGKFQIGDPVSFQSEGKTITGTVIRVNRKSLSIRSQESYFYGFLFSPSLFPDDEQERGILSLIAIL